MKYVHTNIIARDWKRLSQFYIDVFHCKPILPKRNLKGKWLDEVTNMKEAHILGIHLRLPGYNENGPTLEIFQYDEEFNGKKLINKEGFSHITFSVENVEECVEKIKEHGGGILGKIVNGYVEGLGKIHFAYTYDPEGNIIEIQKWE